MPLAFLHISPCVSLKVKPGSLRERKNYSTSPLIDSAGDYDNSYTSMLPLGCHGHEMLQNKSWGDKVNGRQKVKNSSVATLLFQSTFLDTLHATVCKWGDEQVRLHRGNARVIRPTAQQKAANPEAMFEFLFPIQLRHSWLLICP